MRNQCNANSTLYPLLNDGSYCTVSHDCVSCNCVNNKCTAALIPSSISSIPTIDSTRNLTTATMNAIEANVVGTSSDGYNIIAFTKPNNKNATFTLNNSASINVFMVGGGGNGAGGGGGAGGVVQQTITLPAGKYSVNVGNLGKNSNLLGSDRTSWIKNSGNNIVFIAYAGGDSTGFNNGSSRPGKGGSGAGAAWGGNNGSPGEAGIQTQSGNIKDGRRNTIWAAGTGNTADNNIANPGGKGMMNIDIKYNNWNIGNGGGGGAGTPGGDATLIQNIGGNDQDGNPIGPIKGGKGGDGILCTLPGIKNFSYDGKNWGQLYWAGGGGAGFSGYIYTYNDPLDYTKPVTSADGGKGGGGGGEGPWTSGSWPNGTRASGKDDNTGLNPANDKNPGYVNSGGNTGGAGGLNTGGGGGGQFDSGYGGEGGSGIVIISFK